MTQYLLDTNAISDLMAETPRVEARVLAASPADRIFTCVAVVGEVWFGVDRLPAGRRQRDLRVRAARVLARLDVEPVPTAAADHYARSAITTSGSPPSP